MKSHKCYGPMRAVSLTAAMCLTLILGTGALRAAVPTGTPTFSNPLNFTNRYQPFQPGGVKIFQGLTGRAKSVVVNQYLIETRSFAWNGANVQCHILREIDFEGGQLVEISDNHFAQADDGTVYYFGELVDNYEDGVLTNHDGSWLVGGPGPADPPGVLTDTDPTVFMPAIPGVGDRFKPEDLLPQLDETDNVKQLGITVKVTAGRFKGAIKIEETSSLEPGTTTKWYAPGVGVVKEKARGESLQLIASTLVSPEEPE